MPTSASSLSTVETGTRWPKRRCKRCDCAMPLPLAGGGTCGFTVRVSHPWLPRAETVVSVLATGIAVGLIELFHFGFLSSLVIKSGSDKKYAISERDPCFLAWLNNFLDGFILVELNL